MAIAQTAVAPAFLPPVLRPDLSIMVGLVALALAPREAALILLFGLGVQADLFGSARFGLLTLSYLLAAGVILWCAWREFTRGDLLAAWIGVVAGTGLAHFFYLLFGRFFGLEIDWSSSATTLMSLTLAAAVWGLPCAYLCGKCMYRLGVVTPTVRERWNAEARIASARKGKTQRKHGF
ncbi:MAG: hypothetical protein V1899_07725 [Planctomycetota bacterium]